MNNSIYTEKTKTVIIPVDSLIPHPRNEYFFDDMSGDNWDTFVDSVRERGVITPITVTKDTKSDYYVIVSGHQRVRACQKLGIPQIKAEIREYENEDDLLLDLIYTNIRQRGNGNPNQVKLGRCIKELERIHGVRQGKKPHGAVINTPTQEDIAKELRISTDTLRNYKKLAEMIPELQDLIMDGKISPKAATALTKRLSQSEQLELIQSLDATKRYTQSEIDAAVSQYKIQIEADRQKYSRERSKLTTEIQQRDAEIERLYANPPKPADYDSTRKQNVLLKDEAIKKDDLIKRINAELEAYRNQASKYTESSEEYQRLMRKVEALKEEVENLKVEKNAQMEMVQLMLSVREFLTKQLAPVKFMECFRLIRSKPVVGADLINIVDMVDQWSAEMHKITDTLPRIPEAKEADIVWETNAENIVEYDNTVNMDTYESVDVDYDTGMSDYEIYK